MLKELLLQFFLSVLPVFAFLLWHDKERGWKGVELFIAAASGISIVLCMLTSLSLYQYDLDYRVVPLLIGSLYGGFRAMLALSVLYVCLRIPALDSNWETISFVVFLLLFIALWTGFIQMFQASGPERKERIGALLMSLILIYASFSFGGFMQYIGAEWTVELIAGSLLAIMGLLLSTWLSIFIIEGIKEKQSLYDKVLQLSDQYRNEVEKLQQFIDKAPLAVMIVDHNGVITNANEESVKLLNLKQEYGSAERLTDIHYKSVFQSAGGETGIKLLHDALNGQVTMIKPNLENNKMLLYISVVLRDVTNDHISGAALIAQDVTELSQLRNEVGRMERLSLVGQMAASITHEIRNPMAVIRGFVQLIQERSPQSQHQYFRIIMGELDRANMIISDFLSLAQNRELNMEPSSLNETINDLIPLIVADANLRGQSVEVDLCGELPPIMLNDREIKQMLLNLARNGMEAMDEKGVLRISTHCEKGAVSIRIADEGVGISQEQMKQLFEPFYTTKTRGTGLGLPLCLSIAERHGGRIEVESVEGKGTTFIVTFDISAQAAEHTSA